MNSVSSFFIFRFVFSFYGLVHSLNPGLFCLRATLQILFSVLFFASTADVLRIWL
jgi:hypothetical protein